MVKKKDKVEEALAVKPESILERVVEPVVKPPAKVEYYKKLFGGK